MADDRNVRFVYSPLQPDHIRLLHILPESTPDDIRCSLERYELAERDELLLLK